MLATFQATFRKPEITADDRAAGIIRGVYVMELGKLAQFSARRDDGTKTHRAVTLDDAHLAALMNHAGNRSIPVHMTHSHTSKEQDGLVTKAGALKGFYRDDSKTSALICTSRPAQLAKRRFGTRRMTLRTLCSRQSIRFFPMTRFAFRRISKPLTLWKKARVSLHFSQPI